MWACLLLSSSIFCATQSGSTRQQSESGRLSVGEHGGSGIVRSSKGEAPQSDDSSDDEDSPSGKGAGGDGRRAAYNAADYDHLEVGNLNTKLVNTIAALSGPPRLIMA
ncbi:hypothetical protein CBR_g50850 [Chara braunii]|uniref:Uncharacterized protein n=1 Tax=Chara braunii TaxID=69332 RepID=A0A388M7L9_CHABU|nr:hypothetical protein CBR_g50850 [Chara braunii]|eukprot:GBG90505.1 hypothetical protein CBR_g50850 [Chara braunii]